MKKDNSKRRPQKSEDLEDRLHSVVQLFKARTKAGINQGIDFRSLGKIKTWHPEKEEKAA